MASSRIHRTPRLAWLAGIALCCLPTAQAAEVADAPAAASASTRPLSPLATTGPLPHPIVPPSREEITSAIDRGVAFLLQDQRPDGSWGSAENTKGLNIYAPVPGAHHAFRTAVTSLALLALIDAQPHLPDDRQAAVDEAIERGEAWLDKRLGRLRRATPDAIYNVWGHAYSLHALAALHERAEGDAERQSRLKELAAGQFDRLERYSSINGGWGYYDFEAGTQIPASSSSSFTTATALIAIDDARQAFGLEFSERLIDKAIDSLHRQQKPDFTYAYGEYLKMRPMYSINRAGGSLGRSQVCNLALRYYGDERVTDEVIMTWLNRLYARNGWLSIGRKRPIPHESHFAVAGYFYYYGHFYAAMSIDELPENERPYFREHLAHILLPLQESDGTWWDYPFYNYHQQYGTAMAVWSLTQCVY